MNPLIARDLALMLARGIAVRVTSPLRSESGAAGGPILAIIMGVITIVVGLVLFTTILSQATTSGDDSRIGSFSGAQALNDLVPLVYIAAIVVMGVGLIGLGGLKIAKGM